MRNLMLLTLGVSGLLIACMNTEPESAKVRGKALETETGPGPAKAASISSTESPYFKGWSYGFNIQNITSVEKDVRCNWNGILTGIGGRVSNGNFTGVRAWCRDIQPNGTLGAEYTITSGSTSIEANVRATAGYAALSVGGRVDGSTFTRAVIKECPYDPATRKVLRTGCRLKSSDGSTAIESQNDISNFGPTSCLTGFGFTAGYEELKVVKVWHGLQWIRSIYLTGLSGGELNYSFTPPPSANTGYSRFRLYPVSSSVGDADLHISASTPYVGQVNNSTQCNSMASYNTEVCTMNNVSNNGQTWNALVHAYNPYTNVTFEAEYSDW